MPFDPDSYLAKKKAPASGGFNPDAYLASKKIASSPAETKPSEPGIGAKVLDYGLRGLDYAGGLTRTAAADAADTVMGGGKVTGDDWRAALHGKAPSSADYMDKLGVPAGAHVDLNPFAEGDSSVRDIGGFIGDVALDPLTYASAGIGAALKEGGAKVAAKAAGQGGAKEALAKALGKTISGSRFIVNPAEAVDLGGKKLYKSAFKNIDTRLAEKGVAPISGDLMDQGFRGGYKKLDTFTKERLKDLGDQRAALYREADAAGKVVDPIKAAAPADQFVDSVAGNGYGSAEVAQKLKDTLAKTPSLDREAGLSLEKASAIKSDLYNKLPAAAFDPNGRLTNDGKKLLQKLASGYKEEIVAAGDAARSGLGQEVNALNEKMGPYLSAKKPTQSEIAKASRKDLITQTKAALATLSPSSAAAMYGAGFLNSPLFKTNMGILLQKTAPVSGAALRRGEVDLSPWTGVRDGSEN